MNGPHLIVQFVVQMAATLVRSTVAVMTSQQMPYSQSEEL
jgi:hypothetical protein